MLEFIKEYSWIVGVLTDITVLIGVPLAIVKYFKSVKEDKIEKQYDTYDALDEKYIEFQKLCLSKPYLNVFDINDGLNIELTPIQKKEEIIAYSILISIFERAYIMYERKKNNEGNQWEGWLENIIDYCKRDNFVKAWEKNGKIASGILSALINLGKINLFFIIYLFTNKDFRRQGLATELINSIIKTNKESFFLAEVLDPNKTSDALEAMENKYSGVDTDDREFFWRKNRFHKLNFNYYNPSPDINNYCNGFISYNSLWINNDNKLIFTKEDILYGLKIYFRYGYCANQIEFHDFEAYNKNKEQFSSLSLNEIYEAI